MGKLKVLLALLLVLTVASTLAIASTCRRNKSVDFSWENQNNGQVKFTSCHPEKFDYYKWSFGDDGFYATHQDQIVHSYQSSGTFEVRMKARNTYGNWVKTYRQVTISDQTESLSVSTSSFTRDIANLSNEVKLGIGVGIVTLIFLM